MKILINTIILISCLSVFVSSCEIDNYDGPDASFYGEVIDEETGELVETELLNGSAIRAYEQGFENPAAQTWRIKNTGEFRNDMVFSGIYDFELINGNFFPFTVEDFEIRPGENNHDFTVTPYIRITNAEISHVDNQIIATFSLEAGGSEVRVAAVRLYAFTDMHVGEQISFSTTGDNYSQTFNPSREIDESEVFTLSIDLDENSDDFKYSRNYYFRIGALADVADVGTVRHNYAPLEVIEL